MKRKPVRMSVKRSNWFMITNLTSLVQAITIFERQCRSEEEVSDTRRSMTINPSHLLYCQRPKKIASTFCHRNRFYDQTDKIASSISTRKSLPVKSSQHNLFQSRSQDRCILADTKRYLAELVLRACPLVDLPSRSGSVVW